VAVIHDRSVKLAGDEKDSLYPYHSKVVRAVLLKYGYEPTDKGLLELLEATVEAMNDNSFGWATRMTDWNGYETILSKLIEDVQYSIINRVNRCPCAIYLIQIAAALEVSRMSKGKNSELAGLWYTCDFGGLLDTAIEAWDIKNLWQPTRSMDGQTAFSSLTNGGTRFQRMPGLALSPIQQK
jgi:hypothetical protein